MLEPKGQFNNINLVPIYLLLVLKDLWYDILIVPIQKKEQGEQNNNPNLVKTNK